MSNTSVTAAHVRDVILRDLDRRTGRNGDWEVHAVRRVRESWLFKAHTSQAPWPLAIKVYSTAMPPGLAARQIKLLEHYHASMEARPGLTVPTPWAAVPEHRAILMEWIEHPRMDQALRRARRASERQPIIATAGRWLRHFHDQGEQLLAPLNPTLLLRPVDVPLGGEGAGATVRDPAFRRAYRILREQVSAFGDTPVPCVTPHGDFTPANVFYGGKGTVGFDFVAGPAQPFARDILHFLVFARCDSTNPWTRLTCDVQKQDLRAFMSAYGQPTRPVDERLLMLFRLAEALRRWSYLLDRMRRLGFNPRRVARALRLRSIAKGAADLLEQG